MRAPPPAPLPSAAALAPALATLLRPLVRFLIRRGIGFPAFMQLVRRLYIEAASADLAGGREPSDSRLSLMTGIHRKEIRRVRTEGEIHPRAEPPPLLSLTSALIARWSGGPPYLDERGRARPLPRSASGSEPSFDALAESVTTDVRPRAILDELLRQEIVAIDQDDCVRLAEAAYVPRPGEQDQLFYFARNLQDHLAAATANLLAGATRAPFFDRSVHYDRLTPETAARLEEIGRQQAMALLQDVNQIALRLSDADDATEAACDKGGLKRFNLGIYLLIEDDPEKGVA